MYFVFIISLLYTSCRDLQIISNSFLNHQFMQNIFDTIFSTKVDPLFKALKETFINSSIPLTTREIEKLTTRKIIAKEFGDILEIYFTSKRMKKDAYAFVDKYYSHSECNRCMNQTCRACRHLYAFLIFRYWKFRDQSKDIYRQVAVSLILFLPCPDID